MVDKYYLKKKKFCSSVANITKRKYDYFKRFAEHEKNGTVGSSAYNRDLIILGLINEVEELRYSSPFLTEDVSDFIEDSIDLSRLEECEEKLTPEQEKEMVTGGRIIKILSSKFNRELEAEMQEREEIAEEEGENLSQEQLDSIRVKRETSIKMQEAFSIDENIITLYLFEKFVNQITDSEKRKKYFDYLIDAKYNYSFTDPVIERVLMQMNFNLTPTGVIYSRKLADSLELDLQIYSNIKVHYIVTGVIDTIYYISELLEKETNDPMHPMLLDMVIMSLKGILSMGDAGELKIVDDEIKAILLETPMESVKKIQPAINIYFEILKELKKEKTEKEKERNK